MTKTNSLTITATALNLNIGSLGLSPTVYVSDYNMASLELCRRFIKNNNSLNVNKCTFVTVGFFNFLIVSKLM